MSSDQDQTAPGETTIFLNFGRDRDDRAEFSDNSRCYPAQARGFALNKLTPSVLLFPFFGTNRPAEIVFVEAESFQDHLCVTLSPPSPHRHNNT